MKTNASEDSVKFQRYPVRVRLDLDILLIKGKEVADVHQIIRNQVNDLLDGKRGFQVKKIDVLPDVKWYPYPKAKGIGCIPPRTELGKK